MGHWLLGRCVEVLVAFAIMVAGLWFVVTQPMLPKWFAEDLSVSTTLPNPEKHRLELERIIQETSDEREHLQLTGRYLYRQLRLIGNATYAQRGASRVLQLRFGEPKNKKLFMAFHYVVASKRLPHVADISAQLINVIRVLHRKEQAKVQLHITLFLHPLNDLSQGLINNSLYHADQVKQLFSEGDWLWVLTPGLRVPDAVHQGTYWHYLRAWLPTDLDKTLLLGRLGDFSHIRQLKTSLLAAGLSQTRSVNIPVSFVDLPESPLQAYWREDLPAILVRPNNKVVKSESQYSDFMLHLYALLQKENALAE